jgi:cellulose synthase/poly-beta-1,6-N-acetylglucosamine synthase-like glycosyltransferase
VAPAPRCSIVVPAYNAGATLGACLEALLGQSVPRESCEVIVVDDGSTDDTPAVLARFPVTAVRQGNRGPAAARNRGASLARGEVVLFTDADCVPGAGWVAQMLAPFADARVAAVKGAYRTAQRSLVARFCQAEFEERFAMLRRAPQIDMVDTYAAAFRREVFAAMNGFDESFPVANNEDTDLSWRLAAAGHRMVFNPEAVVSHLKHPDTLRKYARQKFWRGYWRMVVYRRFPGKMVRDTYTPQTLKLQVFTLAGAAAALAAGLVWAPALWLSAASLLVFLASAAPFALQTAKRDKAVALLSPLFLAVRAASIGAGVLWYALSARRTKIESVPAR